MHALTRENVPAAPLSSAPDVFDAVILGGGPSGCSCALWLKMLGFSACIVDRRKRLGGLQNDSPYPNRWIVPVVGMTGQGVAAQMHRHVLEHGVALKLGFGAAHVTRQNGLFHVTNADGSHVIGKRLVIATGVVPVTGDLTASDSLLIGPGVQIAERDFAGKRVAILGGGDNAFENYLFIKNRGAQRVRLFARSLRARAEFLRQAMPEDVRVGDVTVNAANRSVNGEQFDLIVVLYGWQANMPFSYDFPVRMTERGFIDTDSHCETSEPYVYAIGEIAHRMHPCCVTAMADGVIAAKAIQRSLESVELSGLIAHLSFRAPALG